jgi:hypothetical protein
LRVRPEPCQEREPVGIVHTRPSKRHQSAKCREILDTSSHHRNYFVL